MIVIVLFFQGLEASCCRWEGALVLPVRTLPALLATRVQWPATICPVSRAIAAFGRRQDHEDGAVVRRKGLLACSWIKVKEGERRTDSSQLLLLKCFISCSL